MDFKRLKFRFFSFFLLFVLLFVFACSTPSWFPIKKGSSSKAAKTTKDLADKEVIIIDKEEYVKVYNPGASGREQPKIPLYSCQRIPGKKGDLSSLSYRKEEPKKEPSSNPPLRSSLSSPGVGDQVSVTASQSLSLQV